METLEQYQHILKESRDVALATSNENSPNVRIITFVYNEENPNILYFSTHRQSNKAREFEKNSAVAITTLPVTEKSCHVRASKATVVKSQKVIGDLADQFIARCPEYEMLIQMIGEHLDVYEIHISEADVIISETEEAKIKF